MPTTFGTNPDSIQAVMAGGKDAFLHTKEGAEDSYEDGARAITRLKPTKKDVVIGVSASGMTPYVRGALTRARKAGSKIIFVTCDPRTELQTFVDVTIAPAVGPEVIAGSTRLKAGTATKLVLNMLTTAAMVRIGKTYGNLMVDLHTSSEKARDRARRIIAMVTGLDVDQADKLLQKARWNVKAAIVMQKTKGGYTQATARLGNRTIRFARRLAKTSSRACASCSIWILPTTLRDHGSFSALALAGASLLAQTPVSRSSRDVGTARHAHVAGDDSIRRRDGQRRGLQYAHRAGARSRRCVLQQPSRAAPADVVQAARVVRSARADCLERDIAPD